MDINKAEEYFRLGKQSVKKNTGSKLGSSS
jgi:hypothetical protein